MKAHSEEREGRREERRHSKERKERCNKKQYQNIMRPSQLSITALSNK